MAFPYSSTLLFILLLTTATTAHSPSKTKEFDDMLQSLHNYGYSLFTNGISTSDLKYELLTAAAATTNFTLFAPRDELLYALDMAADAAFYVSTLRYHVASSRHTFTDLKNLTGPFLDTLLTDYAVLVGKVRDVDVDTDRASIGLVVNGVRIAYPDLFIGSRIVVHGIEGILLTGLNMSLDHENGSGHVPSPPIRSPAPASHPIPAPTPSSASDGDNPVAPPPNDANIPAAEETLTPNSATPPTVVPSNGNTPAKPKSKTPSKGIQTPNATSPAASADIPVEGPNVRISPAAAEIDRDDAPAASGSEWAATPTISQEQIEKMKRLGMKLPGKGNRKGARRRNRRRKAPSDL